MASDGVPAVLTTDTTLLSSYRNVPLAGFLSCVPSDKILVRILHRYLEGSPSDDVGRIVFAPMGLRRFEAALRKGIDDELVLAHPRHLHRWIGSRTRFVGLHTMDPLGLGPVSMMFSLGGRHVPYTKYRFQQLLDSLPDGDYKLVVGGSGTWQFLQGGSIPDGIDHVVIGECDADAPKIYKEVLDGVHGKIIRVDSSPSEEDIPPNLGPTVYGLVEVMRGCGRGCTFCNPNLRSARYIPWRVVENDVRLNVRWKQTWAWLHSDDIFMYRVEDNKELRPNSDAIIDLFRRVMSIKGVAGANPTHGGLASVAADPDLIESLSRLLRAGPDRWIGLQPGLETGSERLLKRYMRRKTLPFSPEEWHDVVVEAVRILNRNYWIPAMTMIIGLPGEEEDDSLESLRLVKRLIESGGRFVIAPLSFVPVGTMSHESFFNIEEMIDEYRFNIIYHTWKYTVRQVDTTLREMSRYSPATRQIIYLIASLGSRMVLSAIERFGRKMGYRILWDQI